MPAHRQRPQNSRRPNRFREGRSHKAEEGRVAQPANHVNVVFPQAEGKNGLNFLMRSRSEVTSAFR